MTPLFALGLPGIQELVVILIIVLLLFGAKRLPELVRGMGQSVNEFKKVREEFEREAQKGSTTAETKKTDEPPTKQA